MNAREALTAVDGVVSIMSKELGWDDATSKKMAKDAKDYIGKMGISSKEFDVADFVIQ